MSNSLSILVNRLENEGIGFLADIGVFYIPLQACLCQGKAAGAVSPGKLAPDTEHLKNYLWLVYYRQQSYRRKHSRYAGSLHDIKLTSEVNTGSTVAKLRLSSTENQFDAVISGANGDGWKIDESGKILPTE